MRTSKIPSALLAAMLAFGTVGVACDAEDERDAQEIVNEVEKEAEDAAEKAEKEIDKADDDGQDD